MADITSNQDRLALSENGFRIVPGVRIGTFDGDAPIITLATATLDLYGDVYGDVDAVGVQGGSGANLLTVRAAGTIDAGVAVSGLFAAIANFGKIAGAIDATSASMAALDILNQGDIYGEVTLRGKSATNGRTALINYGDLLNGADDGAALHWAGGNTSILNHGTIAGDMNAVRFDPGIVGKLVIDNFGSLTANDVAIGSSNNVGNAAIEVTNGGTIAAATLAIGGGSGDDIVVNAGMIFGDVTLGDGSDLFDGRGGTLVGKLTLGNGDDTALGGRSADTLRGDAGSDILSGGGGDDLLDGGTGSDTMSGGRGDDVYYTDDLGDRVLEDAEQGYDIVMVSGNFALTTGSVVELLTVDPSYDKIGHMITGNELVNLLRGGSGDDVLDGGAGDDRLEGGVGNDTYVIDSLNDVPIENLDEGNDTIVTSLFSFNLEDNFENLSLYSSVRNKSYRLYGNAADNVITGGSGKDYIFGGDGFDKLYGGSGSDTLVGSNSTNSGRDILDGGTGNDKYYISNSDDLIFDSKGNDTVYAGVSFRLPDGIENLVAGSNTPGPAPYFVGNDLDNYIEAHGNSVINPGLGSDRIVISRSVTLTYVVDHIPMLGEIDTIEGWGKSDHSEIELDHSTFSDVGPVGQLGSEYFTDGSSFSNDTQRVRWDSSKSTLFYDADGSGSSYQEVALVHLTTRDGLHLQASDIIVI